MKTAKKWIAEFEAGLPPRKEGPGQPVVNESDIKQVQLDAVSHERKLKRQVRIARRWLNFIASWSEGKNITSGFDEPVSTHNAREALKEMNAV